MCKQKKETTNPLCFQPQLVRNKWTQPNSAALLLHGHSLYKSHYCDDTFFKVSHSTTISLFVTFKVANKALNASAAAPSALLNGVFHHIMNMQRCVSTSLLSPPWPWRLELTCRPQQKLVSWTCLADIAAAAGCQQPKEYLSSPGSCPSANNDVCSVTTGSHK